MSVVPIDEAACAAVECGIRTRHARQYLHHRHRARHRLRLGNLELGKTRNLAVEAEQYQFVARVDLRKTEPAQAAVRPDLRVEPVERQYSRSRIVPRRIEALAVLAQAIGVIEYRAGESGSNCHEWFPGGEMFRGA